MSSPVPTAPLPEIGAGAPRNEYASPTGNLRHVQRLQPSTRLAGRMEYVLHLQQEFSVRTFADSYFVDQRLEWRDVPVVIEPTHTEESKDEA